MAALLLALISAAAYGVSDFLGGLASRRVAALRVVLVSYPVSALVIAVMAPFVGGRLDPASLAWGAASGAVMAVAMWCFYSALAEGPMSVVSPVTAVMVAGVPVVVGVALGERLSPVSIVGILLAIAAIVLVSRESAAGGDGRRFTPRVARLTLAAGTCFALSFVFTDRIDGASGLWALVAARVVASCLVAVAAMRSKESARLRGRLLVLAVGVGLLDVVANIGMLYAFRDGMLSLMSVLIALYPAVTVGLAVAVLRERVGPGQLLGMALATGAVVTIAVAG
ncbi:EamA family transporter [Rathayibacter sp. VKM Ac-2803]|uniref:EamA family transporter n=1 Tax=unclassified Rathayibacter TaxID=2609250 RepID=UPI00135CC83E|nr:MULTISPECIES: EamA family transporter [unclassified Rathayibacter]MWV49885.1 EamA family transporter [Rathayibacter sp. VKM Ac-2803]MWV58016.1 EamA family transporter [Rathayibacter sp. VKM Ac-2754]